VCGLDGEGLVEAHDPLLERTLGDYRIVATIGDGGMARVYRAIHVRTGATRALKVLFGQYATDPVVAERFRREVQAAMRIRHPNVVLVEGHGEVPPGVAYMVMELIEGETLAETLARERSLSPKRAGDIAGQIACGLVAAHTQGFVHRDLKPKNVMLARERVKLLDFGLVAMVGSPLGDVTQLTGTGILIGTPAYMSPEQINGDRVGPRTDLYSLGVILYQMLTGRVPFDGTRAKLLTQHLTQRPAPLPPSGGLEDLTLRLLEKEPEHRPASALEVVERLEALGLLDGAKSDTTTAANPIAPVAIYSWQEPDNEGSELRAEIQKRLSDVADAPVTDDTMSEPDRVTLPAPDSAAQAEAANDKALVALPIPVSPQPSTGDTLLDSAAPQGGQQDASLTTVDTNPFFEAPPDSLLAGQRNVSSPRVGPQRLPSGAGAREASSGSRGARPEEAAHSENGAAPRGIRDQRSDPKIAPAQVIETSRVPALEPEAPTLPLGGTRPVARTRPPVLLMLLLGAALLVLIVVAIIIAVAPTDSDPVVLGPGAAPDDNATVVIPPQPAPAERR
jgi:serine/threonine protein kinase